ncbi:mitochondrial carrier [Lactarius psammicola]|nr:mitochondrial carrier [Lactarius psammicola]
MNPLDLSSRVASGGHRARHLARLARHTRQRGMARAYRGLGPNVAGNASSWGSTSLVPTSAKRRATVGALRPALVGFPIPALFRRSKFTPFPLLSTLLTPRSPPITTLTALSSYRDYRSNHPIWVVTVRMFPPRQLAPRLTVGSGAVCRAIFATRALGGLYRGTSLALVGVSNSALQFMAYEKMKSWAFERKRRHVLSNTAYTVMSGTSKLGACARRTRTRFIRSRIQVPHEGLAGFSRGLTTNLVRVLPGTCVTFVVYENIAWLLKRATARREARRGGDEGSRRCIYR